MDFNEVGASKQTKPYVVPFREDWAKLFPWLEKEKDGKSKRCILCRVPIIGGVAHIKRHAIRDTHVKNMNATKTTPKINSFLTAAARCPVAESARKLEIMLSAFVAEHYIPFATLDHLNHIIKNGINDSQITKKFNIYRQKGQQIVTNLIGPENTTSISSFCKNNYYSLVIDESTDCSISKNLAIVIRTFDGQCRDRFLGMVQLEDATANGIYESTIKTLHEKNIPIQNMVGITTDNCAVMMGSQNGVQIKFKNLVPQLFSNGCICHILNLASLAAAKIGIPNEIDKFIRDINYYFCNSASRRDDFVKFQEHFGTDIHIIFKYATTRWLSRQEVVDRIVEQWEPLQYYFTLENFEADARNEKLLFLSSGFKNPSFKLHFLFMQYALKIINMVNLEMQSEDARMHVFLQRLTYLFRQIARNFMNKNVLDECDISTVDLHINHMPFKEIYCGTEVDLYISTNNINIDIVKEMKENAKQFYIKFCETLTTKVNFNNKVLMWFHKFSHENVISGKTSSIVPLLVKMFPNETANFDSINNQFRALADVEQLKSLKNENICSFWSVVANLKNDLNVHMFPDISRVVAGILSIPHSSANVERVFSFQNIIKTKERNRLHVPTLSSLIQTKDWLRSTNSCCYDVKIPNSLLTKQISP